MTRYKNVDDAIVDGLGLDPSSAKIAVHGISTPCRTFKLWGKIKKRKVTYFVKTGYGADAEAKLRGEYESLKAIHSIVPNFCPRPHAHGPLKFSPDRFFLATDFLDLTPPSDQKAGYGPFLTVKPPRPLPDQKAGSGLSLAAKLARLHTTPTPIPEGRSAPAFGFPAPTHCGETAQDNGWSDSWPEFFAERRLRAIMAEAKQTQGSSFSSASHAHLEATIERIIQEVVPRLLGPGAAAAVPVLVHGDLWHGNHARGRIESEDGGVEEVVYDAAAVYGHSEYELGMMRMFGGFGPEFWSEYCRLVPKASPAEEWDDRVNLYMLYHQMNHYALFGSRYLGDAWDTMNRLLAKYGKYAGK